MKIYVNYLIIQDTYSSCVPSQTPTLVFSNRTRYIRRARLHWLSKIPKPINNGSSFSSAFPPFAFFYLTIKLTTSFKRFIITVVWIEWNLMIIYTRSSCTIHRTSTTFVLGVVLVFFSPLLYSTLPSPNKTRAAESFSFISSTVCGCWRTFK